MGRSGKFQSVVNWKESTRHYVEKFDPALIEATGGYIIVKSSGDVLTYYIYNRDSFKKYLLNNTRLDSGSSSKHNYGTVYSDNDIHRIKLNLQIRFNDN